jgi:hypothetical protein
VEIQKIVECRFHAPPWMIFATQYLAYTALASTNISPTAKQSNPQKDPQRQR